MKNFTNNFKQFTSRLSARWLIMALMMLVGTSSAWAAQNNIHWQGKIYFLAPEKWDLSTYKYVQVDITRTTSASASNHQEYIGNMTRIGTSRLFYVTVNANHTNWNQNEYIAFTANDHNYDSGSFTLNNNHYYTVPLDYGCNNASNYYLFKPSSESQFTTTSNGNTVTGDWNSNRDDLLELEQKVSIYTGGSLSADGGEVSLKGYYFTSDNAIAQSTATSSSTSAKYDAVVGSVMTVTATANANYEFDGWYTEASGGTLLSSSATYTYNVYGTKTIYARFTQSCTTPSKPTLSNTSDTTCPNVNYTLPTATNKGTYTQKWYNSNGTEVTSPVKVSTQTKYTTKLIDGTCESEATEFTLNVTSKPATPVIVIGNANICAGEETYISVSSPLEGYTYKLYKNNTEVNGATLNNENKFIISEEGSYTVKVTAPQTACGLTSDPSQAKTLTVTSVTLELNPTSAPVCSSATIADISTYVTATTTVTPSGTASVNWYASEDATTVLTDEVLEAKIYYAEAETTSGCKSDRQSFEVTSLMTAPSKPVITPSDDAICSGNAVTLTLETKVAGETYTIGNTEVFTKSNTWSTPALNSTTDYIVKATNSCGSTDSEELTINVTTTPTITGPSATQPNKEITLSSAAGANTKWETSSGSTLTPANGAETVFTATGNGSYTITARYTENNITCSATHPIVVNDKFYIYIRRPKSGTTTYNQWYEKTNDADKGAHPWMKNGSEYKTGDDYTNNNYDGYGPESTFTDCNGYVWDAFIAPGTSFFIHAPNTFQEGGQVGYATFTQVTNITSTATDLYYTINQWAGSETKGTTLSPASEPNRIPEVAVPVLSIDPVSGIICQGAEATITVTNPENGVSYKLNYEGKDQTNSIAYTGTGNVEFAVTEAGTYLVKAETTSGTCKGNAISIAREIQVITTSIAFVGAPYVTTPWEPITITVNIPKGYNYTFNDTQLTQIASPDTPIKKVSGSEYTYSFPRPQEWGTGNSQTGDSWGEKSYTISATLNGVTESCGTTTATVKLQDEGNDHCNP